MVSTIKGVDCGRGGIVQLGCPFDSTLLYFLMKVAGAHAYSSREKSLALSDRPEKNTV